MVQCLPCVQEVLDGERLLWLFPNRTLMTNANTGKGGCVIDVTADG